MCMVSSLKKRIIAVYFTIFYLQSLFINFISFFWTLFGVQKVVESCVPAVVVVTFTR